MPRDDEDDVIQNSNLQPPIITARVSSPQPPAMAESHLRLRRSSAKPNPKILALILKALVMIFVVSLFFIFVGIAAIFLLHICFAGGALHRRHRRHRHFVISPISDSDQQNLNLGLSMEDLDKLPLFIFSQIEESQACVECVVCLEGFKDGDFLRKLEGCRHVFHSTCVDKWLIKVAACPICRCHVKLNE